MKRQILILAAAMMLSTGAFADTNNATYHFSAYTFATQQFQYAKLFAEGSGNPDICKYLFMPPQAYDGRSIPIPTNAIVFGVVAVTDGKTNKVVPLFTWSDNERKNHFACNGPQPPYARLEDTQEGLLKSILGALKNY
jgi:hypothetical protein